MQAPRSSLFTRLMADENLREDFIDQVIHQFPEEELAKRRTERELRKKVNDRPKKLRKIFGFDKEDKEDNE